MEKISSKANTNEIAEVFVGVIDLSKKHPIVEDPYYSLTLGKISTKSEDLIGKINSGSLTNELRESDELRDIDVKALFYEVEAKCMYRPGAIQEKSLEISETLERTGMKIVNSSYTNESAQIRAMLSDLNAPELADAIASNPALSPLISNLEASQAAFDSASAKSIEGKLKRDNTKAAWLVANEAKDIFNNELCTYLGSMAMANPDKYKPLADLMNVLIEESNKKVRDRLTALKKRKTESVEVN
tara:strand:- start:2814 stop:3545 length:732 start_codon:yes stop_codon:yes gene_type:complete